MGLAKHGNWVQVHYTGRTVEGEVFDSSIGRDPLEFRLGGGQVIPGFEDGVRGMNPGESKTISIPMNEAYGPHREDMVVIVDRGDFPMGVDIIVGQQLQVREVGGDVLTVMVTDLSESEVTLDANHPLAGKDLLFDIQLVGISNLATMPHGSCGCDHSDECCDDHDSCDHHDDCCH